MRVEPNTTKNGEGRTFPFAPLPALGELLRRQREMTTVFKPVLLSGLTTIAGFGSLATAENPALRGLGTVCALGVVT